MAPWPSLLISYALGPNGMLWYICVRFGRRRSLIGYYAVSGIALLLSQVVPVHSGKWEESKIVYIRFDNLVQLGLLFYCRPALNKITFSALGVRIMPCFFSNMESHWRLQNDGALNSVHFFWTTLCYLCFFRSLICSSLKRGKRLAHLKCSLFFCTGDDMLLAHARTVFSMISKFSITAAFIIVFLYTPEIFPTMIRSASLWTTITR